MPADRIAAFAPAKVNLYLHVTGRRADGYHLLDSLAVFPAVGDVVRAEPAEALSLAVTGPFGAALADEADNLMLRAARALGPNGARLELEKNLPVASGIGGGSADAAATLRVLCQLWDLAPGLSPPDLLRIALSLGADVPVCLASQPVRMAGIGEILTPAPILPACGMVLVNPGVAVATPAVFRARTGAFSAPATLPDQWGDATDMADHLADLSNDLEPPAIALCPVIGDVLLALAAAPGCLLARMSGSGATCFGLFPDAAAAADTAASLARPGWWCWGGALGGTPGGS